MISRIACGLAVLAGLASPTWADGVLRVREVDDLEGFPKVPVPVYWNLTRH